MGMQVGTKRVGMGMLFHPHVTLKSIFYTSRTAEAEGVNVTDKQTDRPRYTEMCRNKQYCCDIRAIPRNNNESSSYHTISDSFCSSSCSSWRMCRASSDDSSNGWLRPEQISNHLINHWIKTHSYSTVRALQTNKRTFSFSSFFELSNGPIVWWGTHWTVQ